MFAMADGAPPPSGNDITATATLIDNYADHRLFSTATIHVSCLTGHFSTNEQV
jgi:hypothetical protein